MLPIVHTASGPVTALAVCLLVTPTAEAQDSARRALPAPPDVDQRLTPIMREMEQRFVDVIVRKDSATLERILAPEFTLRVADVPHGSLPRAMWMDNTLHRLKAESVELKHVAARRLAENVAAVSLIFDQKGRMGDRDFSGVNYLVDFWKQNEGSWQLVARYGSPVGKPPERENRTPPPPTDIDSQLTDTLGKLEQRLGDLAVHGYKDTQEMKRLVGSDFTLRVADAPERSLPRNQWGQSAGAYKIESLDERFHAARRLANDLAVVSVLLTQKASRDGQDRSGVFYVVDVWKDRGGQWQLIARYSSPQGKTFDRPVPR
jgi:hypothetical protein